VNIRGRSPGMKRQTTVRLSRTAIFSVFAGYFSDTLEMSPALLYGDMQSVVGFSDKQATRFLSASHDMQYPCTVQ